MEEMHARITKLGGVLLTQTRGLSTRSIDEGEVLVASNDANQMLHEALARDDEEFELLCNLVQGDQQKQQGIRRFHARSLASSPSAVTTRRNASHTDRSTKMPAAVIWAERPEWLKFADRGEGCSLTVLLVLVLCSIPPGML